MNWTGGSLTKSRNAQSSVTATQKKHFAKVRKRLYHGLQPPLDLDFSTFEPHARITKRAPDQPTLLHVEQPNSDGEETQKLLQDAPNKDNRTPSKSRCSDHHSCDDGSPLLPGSATGSRHLDKKGMAISDEDEFEAKKKELFAMRDWCGLESTRPVRMTFEDPADRDMIGRRRRVDQSASTEKRRHRHQLRRSCRRPPQSSQQSPCNRSDGFFELEPGRNFGRTSQQPDPNQKGKCL